MNDPFQKEATPSRASLAEILAPLRKYRLAAAVGFGLTFAMVNALAWFWAAHYYKAKMQVVVQQGRTDPVVTAAQDSAVGGLKQITTDQVSSEVALIKGTDMLESAARTCGLADSPPLFPRAALGQQSDDHEKAEALAKATDKLAQRLQVEAEPTSDVIQVSYGHRGSPETPACVLQLLAQLYVEKHLKLRRQAGSALLFAQQAEQYKKDLEASEARMIKFSRANGSGDPEAEKYALAQQLATSEGAFYRATESVSAADGRMSNVIKQMQTVPARSPASSQETAAYLLIQNLQGSLLNEQLHRTQLLVKYDATFPLVREVDQEISETQLALESARQTTYLSKTTDRDATFEYLRQDLAKTEADVALASASTIAIKSSVNGLRAQIVKLEELAIQKAALEREIKANESKYLLYLNKREQEHISTELDRRLVADVAIAVPATVPVLPAYNPILILAIGTLVAVIVGASAAYVAEYLDPFMRTREDIDRELGVAVLATFAPSVS
jgi:uncharacterized protein involved in exopolysaccharide biosynthesis